MNFFYSVPSTCYTHIIYYPKEKKEKNIISRPCKEKEREREGGSKKERKKERKQEIYSHALMDGMWFCLTPFSHFLNACNAGVSIDRLVKTKKDK
jgi:hypothetical protein